MNRVQLFLLLIKIHLGILICLAWYGLIINGSIYRPTRTIHCTRLNCFEQVTPESVPVTLIMSGFGFVHQLIMLSMFTCCAFLLFHFTSDIGSQPT